MTQDYIVRVTAVRSAYPGTCMQRSLILLVWGHIFNSVDLFLGLLFLVHFLVVVILMWM